MSTLTRTSAALGLALALAAPTAGHAEPGVQPGLVESLCLARTVPDPDCVTIAYPGVDVWAVSATLPIEESATAAYDALIPAPFTPPSRRELGVLMFRLDIPANPSTSIESDPGEGYAEGSVAIRVGFPAAEGFPYREGWWDLAQPLNDASQYGAGRGVGLPKYMATAAVRRDPDGSWRASATDWGKHASQSGPGISTVPGGNILEINWTPSDPGVSADRAQALRSFGQYGEPLFLNSPPHDETGDRDPAMVKFTPAALIPVSGVARTPATEFPDPMLGTVTVRLEGLIPGSGDDVSAGSFADLLAPGPHTVAGTVAFARGYAFLTSDNLANNVAPPEDGR